MQLGEGQAAIAVGVAITERLEALDAKHSPRLATCLTGSAMNSVFAASLQSPTPQPCEARTRTTVHVQVCGQILRRLGSLHNTARPTLQSSQSPFPAAHVSGCGWLLSN